MPAEDHYVWCRLHNYSGQIGKISAADDVKTAGEAVMNQIWEVSKKAKYFRSAD